MSESLLEKGFSFLQEQRKQEAEEVFLSLLKKNKNNFQALHHLALINSEKGYLDLAIEQVESSLKLYPYDPIYWSNYGYMLFQSHAFAKALDAHKKALDLNPRLQGSLEQIIDIFILNNEYSYALQSAYRMKKTFPFLQRANNFLIKALLTTKNYTEANTYVKESIGLRGSEEDLIQADLLRVQLLEETHEHDKAWKQLEKVKEFMNKVLLDRNIDKKVLWQTLRSYQSNLKKIERITHQLPHPSLTFIYAFPQENLLSLFKSVVPADSIIDQCIDYFSKKDTHHDNLQDVLHLRQLFFSQNINRSNFEIDKVQSFIISRNMFSLTLIQRLFPYATHILLSLAPQEQCINSFRSLHSIDSFCANSLNFEDMSRLYHRIMSLFLKGSHHIPFQHIRNYQTAKEDLKTITTLSPHFDTLTLDYSFFQPCSKDTMPLLQTIGKELGYQDKIGGSCE